VKTSPLREFRTPLSRFSRFGFRLAGASIILAAAILNGCRHFSQEPVTLTFLNPEWSHDVRERSLFTDARLQEFTEQTGIRAKHLPAPETSPGQLELVRDGKVKASDAAKELEKKLVAITGFETGPPAN
jgi:hypothetical protein